MMADIRLTIETGVTAQPSNLAFIMGRKGGGDKATANHDADWAKLGSCTCYVVYVVATTKKHPVNH